MRGLFSAAQAFNGDITSWYGQSLQNDGCLEMFRGASSLNKPVRKPAGWDITRARP